MPPEMASSREPAGASSPSEPSGARRLARYAGTARRRLLADRAARWVVTGGGLAIIASILGILLFILIEIWPLVRGASVAAGEEGRVAVESLPAVRTDEYRSHVAALSPDGTLRVWTMGDFEPVLEQPVIEAPVLEVGAAPGQQLFTAATDDGRVHAVPLDWEVSFRGQDRVVTPVAGDTVSFQLEPAGSAPLRAFSVRLDEEGAGAAAGITTDGRLAVVAREVETNLFSGETSESFERFETTVPPGITTLVLDRAARNLYAGTAHGEIVWWTLSGGEPERMGSFAAGDSPVTALTLLIGDRALVVGQADGSLSIWFQVRQPDESFLLERVRDFPPLPGGVKAIAPSLRDKGFVALGSEGRLGLYYSTSQRVLWTGRSPLEKPQALFLAPRGDGALLAGNGRVASLSIRNPHPEVSLKALFGPVWYEGYTEPDYVWQSSGGTDDFEPKLSLTPLMIGTLKGTFYSLLLAIPLGVLGAMYTSQFMHAGYKRYVKPAVEIMAALPSVVLGFLAGLWLAPRVEQIVPALLVMLVLLPVVVLIAGLGWRSLPLGFRNRFPMGSETIVYMVVVALGFWLSLELGPWWERLAFGGDFQAWLLDATGLRYDQRNALVVGLAMGFAVIPIIFSIAEDAFSNVPRNMVAGSLALGANRWQTVTRVVLPTASPGIFSAIIIGFGRAVGETMIVLMATGNTPIMDWSPFNGFRTLSANIAVEIPEAPHGGTLYRTLFLAALILFVITFVINTFAELIRQRLRRRYSQL